MPRSRKPLIIDGAPVALDAPGLETRRDGELYWVASKDARKAGYTPRTVRLFADLANAAERARIETICRIYQAEMADWMADPDGQSRPLYDGTIRSLVECYERDKNSPYRLLEPSTQTCYSEWGRALTAVAGDRRVDRATGQDIRAWFHIIMQPAAVKPRSTAHLKGPRVRLARGAVRQLLPILLAYGAEAGLPGCLELGQVLERMTLRVPHETRAAWKAARPPKLAMTFAQAEAIVDEALARGTQTDRSLALGVAAQFEFTLSQIDVIGSWRRVADMSALPPDAIVQVGRLWRGGLTYEALESGTLNISRSKTMVDAPFDVAEYPLFQKALAAVPAGERSGPLVIDNAGVPLKRRYYAHRYTALAAAAGVPKAVWNMRARHGGLTEGYNAIVKRAGEGKAELADLRIHAQHSKLDTTLGHYVTPGVDATRRVIKARVAERKGGTGVQ